MQRIGSRYPALQMPPLGTELVDEEAVALIHRWIAERDVFCNEAHLHRRKRHAAARDSHFRLQLRVPAASRIVQAQDAA